jgi:hypothetical protein
VDDSTVVSVFTVSNDQTLQLAVNHLSLCYWENCMKLSTNQTKEMLIYFGRKFDEQAVTNNLVTGAK